MRGWRLSAVAGVSLMTGVSAWAQATNVPDARLGPMATDLQNRVGTWCVVARIQFTPSARPVTIAAAAESRFVGNRWLVTELKSVDEMQGFHGLGINGYDPERRIYSGVWIDGTRGFVVPVEGRYDEKSGVFRTSSTERRSNGQQITVISQTVKEGRDKEVTTFSAPDAAGQAYERMILTYTRTSDKSDCKPAAANAPERGK